MTEVLEKPTTSPISTRKHGDVLIVLSNNPPVNALSTAVRQGLVDAIAQAEEDDSVNAFGLGTKQQFAGGVAALDDGRPVAKSLDHCFEQAPLNRVVVDDEHHFRHYTPHARLCRIGAMSPVCLNGLLNARRSQRCAALSVLKTRQDAIASP